MNTWLSPTCLCCRLNSDEKWWPTARPIPRHQFVGCFWWTGRSSPARWWVTTPARQHRCYKNRWVSGFEFDTCSKIYAGKKETFKKSLLASKRSADDNQLLTASTDHWTVTFVTWPDTDCWWRRILHTVVVEFNQLKGIKTCITCCKQHCEHDVGEMDQTRSVTNWADSGNEPQIYSCHQSSVWMMLQLQDISACLLKRDSLTHCLVPFAALCFK